MNIETWPLSRIIPYASNPRKNLKAIDKVAASLKEFGWKQPMVVDGEGVLIVGHTRREGALQLGWAEGPVVVARDLTPQQVKAYRLADNRTNEEAEWDTALLGLELESLKSDGYDLKLTAFNEDELDSFSALLHATPQGETDPDDAPEPPQFAVSVPGDLWILGNHRVLCGDSTVLTDVERVMDGGLADLVVTDPPYNVAYQGKTKDALTIQNDSMSGESFYQFLLAVYTNLFAIAGDGAGIYVFHADSEGANFRMAMVDAGFKLAQCCVWVKQTLVMGRQDYHWQHEPVLYGWKPTGPHRWHSDRKQTTVWKFDRPSRNLEHPTMKPIDLIEYPITNSSASGEVVVDLFGGSGSTLIACEKTARRARLLELDTRYVDVIVKRWQAFTGKLAVHEDGTLFNDRCASALPLAA
jgi:DNA modification methylase